MGKKIMKPFLSPAEATVAMQIERLMVHGNKRLLTLEEAKILDILIKNQRLLDNQSTVNNHIRDVTSSMEDKDLIQIAKSGPDEE